MKENTIRKEELLSEEMEEKVSGGYGKHPGPKCPECGSKNTEMIILRPSKKLTVFRYCCKECGYSWNKRKDEGDSSGALQ